MDTRTDETKSVHKSSPCHYVTGELKTGTNICISKQCRLIKFDKDSMENEASIVYTRFFLRFDLLT